jgi:hypothetical protein
MLTLRAGQYLPPALDQCRTETDIELASITHNPPSAQINITGQNTIIKNAPMNIPMKK